MIAWILNSYFQTLIKNNKQIKNNTDSNKQNLKIIICVE